MPKLDSAPTLWRTCRVLANRKRLEIIQELLRQQPQTVSQLSAKLHLTLPATSQYLRALESRGFLKVKRTRRRVEYRLALPIESEHLGPLLNSIRVSLRENPGADGKIFEFATGFTHPTRIEICRQLKSAPRDISQFLAVMQLSRPALVRHLQKLIRRGYVTYEQRYYLLVTKPPPVAAELLNLV